MHQLLHAPGESKLGCETKLKVCLRKRNKTACPACLILEIDNGESLAH